MKKTNSPFFLAILACLSATVDWGMTIVTLVFYLKLHGGSVAAFGVLATVFMVLQTLSIPLWGKLSDKIGRRRALLIGVLGSTLSILILSFSQTVLMIFVSRILAGLFGGNVAVLSAAMAEVSPPEKRAKNMGFIEAGGSAGLFLIGPTLGGMLYSVSSSMPYSVGAGIGLLNLALVFFLLKESRVAQSTSNRPEFLPTGKFPVLKYIMKRPLAFGGLLIMLIVGLCKAPYEVCIIPYMRYLLNYGPKEAGILMSIFGITVFIVQSVFFGKIVNKLGEINTAKLGFIVSFFGVFFITMMGKNWLPIPASTELAYFLMILDGMGFAMVVPAAASLVLKAAGDPSIRGAAMGTFRASNSVGKLSSPFAGLMFEGISPRAPLILSQFFCLFGFLFVSFWDWTSSPAQDVNPDIGQTTKLAQ